MPQSKQPVAAAGPHINPHTGLLEPAYRLNERQHATVLAALRYWQRGIEQGNAGTDDEFAPIAGRNPLSSGEIEALLSDLTQEHSARTGTASVWEVDICRVGYASMCIRVSAKTREEAIRRAEEEADNVLFSEHASEYRALSAEIVQDDGDGPRD